MKHLFKSLTSWFVAVFFTLISFLFILEIPASAASAGNGNYVLPSNQNVVIIDQTDNETANKTFLDDHLADDLLPSGALGSLVFTNHPLGTIWEINPETIDEIRDMASGYKFGSGVVGAGAQLASAWLTQLKIATSNGIIKALPYSNPSGYWVNRLLPHDSQFL